MARIDGHGVGHGGRVDLHLQFLAEAVAAFVARRARRQVRAGERVADLGHAAEVDGRIEAAAAAVLGPRRKLAQRARAAVAAGHGVHRDGRGGREAGLDPAFERRERVPVGNEAAGAVAHAGHGVEAHVLRDRGLAQRGDELPVVVDGRVGADHLVGQTVQHDQLAAAREEGREVRVGRVGELRHLGHARRIRAGVLRIEGERVETGIARDEELHPLVAGDVHVGIGRGGGVARHLARAEVARGVRARHQSTFEQVVAARTFHAVGKRIARELQRRFDGVHRVDLRVRQAGVRRVGAVGAAQRGKDLRVELAAAFDVAHDVVDGAVELVAGLHRGLLHQQRLRQVEPALAAVVVQRAAHRHVRQARAGVVERGLVGDHAVVVLRPALDVAQRVAPAGRGAQEIGVPGLHGIAREHECLRHVARLLERLAAVVGKLLVVGRELAVGDAARLMARVVAVGRVAQRQRRGLAGGAEADDFGAVDQHAVEATAAEVNGLLVPLLGQVDREVDELRGRIDRRDGAAHAAVIAQRVARVAGGHGRGAGDGGALRGQADE
ncbi:hypothetical protein D9M68_516260 [compost metagenome]